LTQLRLARSLVLLAVILGTPLPTRAASTAPATVDGSDPVNSLANELLAHLQATSAYVRLQSGLPIAAFEPVTLARAQEEAKFNQQMLARIDAVALANLPHEQWLLAKMLRHTFRIGAHAEENYWFDFAVTPYAGYAGITPNVGGQSVSGIHSILAAQPLKTSADLDNYLRLLDSYAVVLDQTAAKTRAQAERGIRVSKSAITGVVAMFRGLHTSASDTLLPAPARLAGVSVEQATAFNAAVQQRLTARFLPGYDAIVDIFSDAYARAAPDEVGIWHYPGGKERYLRLITDYTGLSFSPRKIHDLGERRVAELDLRMQAVRDQLGFKGSREAFHETLRRDPRFIAKSSTEVERRYLGYVARMEPFIPRYFSTLPKAPYGVRRVALAAEKGLTYGYYELPTPADSAGHYNYNGSDLDKRSLISAEHLIFHELIPGHHLHLALQLENPNVHPVRKFLDYGAFTEGWAEYAASLGEEMGLYSDPYDLYGHLLLQSFLASRLVVDTGMNYFNMPLGEARAYMKAHTFESDEQIASETLRYSTDSYAQALGYRLGYEKFWELRHRAEKTLGKDFDIRAFHAAAIGEGSMPLDVLGDHIEWFIAQRH
jgi:uncharacterized protein (DUF885 family)